MSEKKAEYVGKHLEGRVAQILSERELVINIGFKEGVKPGIKFAVLSQEAVEVKDPETGDVLDVIDREKVRVEATEVREKISICRTYRSKTIPGGTFHNLVQGIRMDDMFRQPKVVNESLQIEHSSLPPPLSPEESYVKINDRVVSVAED